MKVTPNGRTPAADRVGVGLPVAVTVKLPVVPSVKVAVLALVITGAVPVGPAAAFTVRMNACTALGETPLAAVNVIG